MPSINKIRLTNVVYEEGSKRYNDELFLFDNYNGAILLENGGGKTVFIQTVLQAMIPHTDLADRKIRNTLVLENAPAHIAVEWLLNDNPRRYVVTAVTLFMTKDGLDSLRYVYEYDEGDEHGIEKIPFVRGEKERSRPADRGEMQDYYSYMREKFPLKAQTFSTIKEYRTFIEAQYHIIANEWESIVKINSSEGGVEAFFEACKNTTQLFDRLLIPTVERSISGHNPNLFADMFEKQHESLKQYKQLKETIEENKRIQEELEIYTRAFEKLHIARMNYEKSKRRAKGLWEEIQSQKVEAISVKDHLELLLSQWTEKEKSFELKSASYQIAFERQKYEKIRKLYEIASANKNNKEEELEACQYDYFSLKLAKCKRDIRQFKEEVAFVEKEIEKLAENEQLQDLKEQMERSKQKLLGYFLETMEELKNEIDNIQYEINPINNEIENIQKEITSNNKAYESKRIQITQVQHTINTRLEDMKRLEQQLLSMPQQEQVSVELEKWKSRFQFLDEEIIRLKAEKKEKEKERTKWIESIEEMKKEESILERKLQLVQFQKEQFDNAQKNVVKSLGKLRPQWGLLESVYEHEKSILNRLYETVEKLNKEKDEQLFKERIAYRLVDDYKEQETFFSDPIIEKRIKTWKNQLDYCVTGIEYLRMLDPSDYEKKASYPLWATTLVTTVKSESILKKKIEAIASQLSFPVQVLTTEEVASIQGDWIEDDFDWIVPTYWENGLAQTTFEQWKEDIVQQARKSTEERKSKETELKQWENMLQRFQEFVRSHPYEKITELQSIQSETIFKKEELKRNIDDCTLKIKEIERQMKQYAQTIDQYKEEMQGLSQKMEKGQQYLTYYDEVEKAKINEKRLLEEIKLLQRKIYRLEEQYTRFDEEKKLLTDRKGKIESRLDLLKEDEDYREIRTLKPIYSGESKKIIEEEIRFLDLKINQVETNFSELELRRKNAKDHIERLSTEMKQIREENENIDEQLTFPPDGEYVLQTLTNKMKQLKEELKLEEEKVHEQLQRKNKQEGALNVLIAQFQNNYPEQEIVTFVDSLDKVKVDLDEEKQHLANEKTYLHDQMKQVTGEIARIDESERSLENLIERHHFNAPQIEPIYLNEDEKTQFRYQREKFTQRMIEELRNDSTIVDKEKKNVEKCKQAFKQFCLTISDMKLRKMAENGVEHKTGYEELLQFKNNMIISVERATNYANEHIRQKDEELQAFINIIHVHLKTVVDELKQIPKYTKVKADDQWKTIYVFTIPEWKEEVGKQRIRNHIEWILNQLQRSHYIKEDGIQDDVKIRKDIEVWLQTKQLLQLVMNNEAMKINCRKVMNNNKVSTRSYSWEQSNQWSGGEKWSKNMTLFLGVLNYVAEKKQHQPKNLKRNRTVILDNPFGKASSDHVLSPVFFVAEQLGFQIIALTAHTEGKFLRDYFPIIYSCRLRESKNPNKKIVTKEKWLHSAYFQDHEPGTLERLIETEQMSLF